MSDKTLKMAAAGAALVMLASTASAIVTFNQWRHARLKADELLSTVLALNTELANRSSATGSLPTPSATPVAPRPELPIITVPVEPTLGDAPTETAEIQRLQARIAELEAVEAEREKRRQEMAERMQSRRDRMQAQDPAEYERRRKEGQERLLDMASQTNERLEFMKAVPVEGLAPAYLENHLAVLERMEFFNSAMAQIAADPEGTAARELMPQVFMNMRGMGEMMAIQREVLLNDYARDLGYDGQNATDFVKSINYITEATTAPSHGLLHQMGHGRGRSASSNPSVPSTKQ